MKDLGLRYALCMAGHPTATLFGISKRDVNLYPNHMIVATHKNGLTKPSFDKLKQSQKFLFDDNSFFPFRK